MRFHGGNKKIKMNARGDWFIKERKLGDASLGSYGDVEER